MVLLVFKCILMIIVISRCSAYFNNDIFTSFILEYIKRVESPTIVTSFLCWEMKSLVTLNAALSKARRASFKLKSSDEIPQKGAPHHTLFLMDYKCNDTIQRLREAENKGLYSFPYRWLIIYTNDIKFFDLQNEIGLDGMDVNKNFSELLYLPGISINNEDSVIPDEINSTFREFSMLPDSNVIIAIPNRKKEILLVSVYRIRSSKDLKVEYLAKWKNDALLFSNVSNVTALRRISLDNDVLQSCFVITDNETHKHLTDYRDKHIDSITKVNFPLTNHLIDFVNGSRRFSFVNSWGYKQKDGSWSGMIGELSRKEADIGGTPLFLTPDRLNEIEYISVTTPTRTKFIFRQPPLSYVENIFLLPFSRAVWLSILTLVIVVGSALYVISKWEDKQNDEKYANYNDWRLHGTISDIVLFSFSAVCQQGSHSEPRSPAGRTLTLFLFIALMFLYTSYSANIVALLQSSTNSIKTLEDLLKSRIKLGVHDIIYNHYYFPSQTEAIRKAIWLQKISPPGQPTKYMNMSEGIAKMRKGLFAFHVELGVGYNAIVETFKEDEKCGLQEIEYLQLIDPWFAIQKDSCYKEMLKLGMRRLQESGLQFREVARIYTKKPTCAGKGASFGSVGLSDAMHPFLWLSIGLGTAVAVLALEIIAHARTKQLPRIIQQPDYNVGDLFGT